MDKKWVSVRDELPAQFKEVYCKDADTNIFLAVFVGYDTGFVDAATRQKRPVTHWVK